LGAAHRLGQRLQELKQQRAAGTDRPEGEDAKLPALADLYAVHKKEDDDCYATLHSSKPVPAKSETSKNFSAYFYGAKAAEDISLNSQVDEKRVRLDVQKIFGRPFVRVDGDN
jgi:hypothetical protein